MNTIDKGNPEKHLEMGCSCCNGHHAEQPGDMTRRKFVRVTGAGAIGTAAFSGFSWNLPGRDQGVTGVKPVRKPLVVKPVLSYDIPTPRDMTSWRSWGGVQTAKAATEEIYRIEEELRELSSKADFPVSFLPVSPVKASNEINEIADLGSADLIIVYAAGGGMDRFDMLNKTGKDIIIFCRHRSGPVYLWYEIISPRYLRQHTDTLKVKGINENDIVIDSPEELLWRMRALCGLKNTVGSRILAIGGPGAWSQPLEVVMKVVTEKYRLDVQDVPYSDLGELIASARKDRSLISNAGKKADEYLKDTGITLEVDRKYVENCFVLEEIFIRLMDRSGCRAITVNNCMGTIMPMAETTACLTLSLLNDEGYLAFCESDFVVVPSGILMANISGKPSFLNDPTYPHDNIITLAHCTAPRRMDGKKAEPARILTHFESDFGAAPKVEMRLGQVVTNIMPDFSFERNVGLAGRIVDNPMLDICRSQIDVRFDCDSRKVAEQMPGFHWITTYGDYLKEAGYAMNKIGIKLDILT
jgi:hypothetical protein